MLLILKKKLLWERNFSCLSQSLGYELTTQYQFICSSSVGQLVHGVTFIGDHSSNPHQAKNLGLLVWKGLGIGYRMRDRKCHMGLSLSDSSPKWSTPIPNPIKQLKHLAQLEASLHHVHSVTGRNLYHPIQRWSQTLPLLSTTWGQQCHLDLQNVTAH